MIIGITGGVGCGKSTVLAELKKMGAAIIMADDVGHIVMKKGMECYEQIIQEFGTEILREDEEIDRKRLGEIVFSDKERLRNLNKIVHPAVKKYIKNEVNELKKKKLLIIIEAALLIEEHYDEICDTMWFIYANKEVRKARLRASRGYTDEKINNIINNQLTDEEFKKHCSVVIDNSGSMEETRNQLEMNLKKL